MGLQTSDPNDSAPDAARPEATVLSRRRVRRFTAVEFLIALVCWIVSAPFLLPIEYGELVETVITALVFVSAVVAVGGRRRTLVIALVLVTPAFVGKWINHFQPDLISLEIVRITAVFFLGFVMVHFLRFILRAPSVNVEVLCAAISVYLLLGILWGFAYMLVAEQIPGSFVFVAGNAGREMVGFEAIYFSFVTLSTVGYGDVVPSSNVSRMLAIMEATIGMFYVTVLIARLVSLYSSQRPSIEVP